MKSRWKMELAVGLVFIAAMAVLGYYTIYMAGRFIEPRGSYRMTVIFPTIEGLTVSSKVKVNGVEAGTVKDMKLIGHQVKVTLLMSGRFTLYSNHVIKIRNESLLGKKCVSIYTGTPLGLDGRPQGVLEQRESLTGSYEDVMASLSEITEENRANIYTTIKNVREITDKMNSGQGTVGKLINQDGIHAQAEELVKELRETIEDAREQAPITSFIRAALTAF